MKPRKMLHGEIESGVAPFATRKGAVAHVQESDGAALRRIPACPECQAAFEDAKTKGWPKTAKAQAWFYTYGPHAMTDVEIAEALVIGSEAYEHGVSTEQS